MSDATTPQKKVIDASQLVDKFEVTVGISQKSGNEYLVGAIYLKSPISDSPIRLGLEYVDPNTRELIKLALDKYNQEQTEEFKNDIQD